MSTLFSALSITQLKTLAVILEHRNLTHAATFMGSSQSVLSKQLAQFREAFDDPLLVRQGGRYLLTERAVALYEPLIKVLVDLENIGQPISFIPEQSNRKFCIAASDYVAEHILPELVKDLSTIAPNISIEYLNWKPNRYDWLANGKVDLAISLFDDAPADFHGRVIGDDLPVCCIKDTHPLAVNENIDLESYLAWSHIKITSGGDKDSFVDSYLRQHDAKRIIRLSVPFFSVALDVVATSDNLLTMPKHLFECSVRNRPLVWRRLDFLNYSFRYWVVWHRRTHASPEQLWFRNFIYQHCQSSQALNPTQLA